MENTANNETAQKNTGETKAKPEEVKLPPGLGALLISSLLGGALGEQKRPAARVNFRFDLSEALKGKYFTSETKNRTVAVLKVHDVVFWDGQNDALILTGHALREKGVVVERIDPENEIFYASQEDALKEAAELQAAWDEQVARSGGVSGRKPTDAAAQATTASATTTSDNSFDVTTNKYAAA